MSAAPQELPLVDYDLMSRREHLYLVPDTAEDETETTSRELFNHYFDLRDQAGEVEKVEGEALHAVQEATRSWLASGDLLALPENDDSCVPSGRFLYYTEFSEELARKRILGLVDYLEQHHADQVHPAELAATRAFIESTYAMYNETPAPDSEVASDADGSFAFIVPARMSRKNTEYGQEVEPVIPAFRYLPNELRSQMLVGLPPFVIDQYREDEQGRRGYLILAPVYGDMMDDMSSLTELINAAHGNVNAAVDFAHRRFGVKTVGLGATLPALTSYGKSITNPNVITTTGHGGTAELINMTIESALQGRRPESVGVLGLGAIGASIAEIVAEKYPIPVNVYDTKASKIGRLMAKNAGLENPKFALSSSEKDLIDNSEVIVSAITSELDPEALGITTMEGKIYVDDSQPGSLDPAKARALGGTLLWVIGSDSQGDTVTRRGYDYATLVDQHTDVFGCEAEAASLYKYGQELLQRGMPEAAAERIVRKVALREAVTPQSAGRIGALFRKFGIVAAQPQAFGEPVQIKR